MHLKNQNEEFQVQNTLGYTFGGDISISNGLSGGLNGNTAFLKQSITNKKVTEQL